MMFTMEFFEEEKTFETKEELENFIEEEHADDPSIIHEIGDITDDEGTRYGFGWSAELMEI